MTAMQPTPLGRGPEFDRIRRAWSLLGSTLHDVGDDAATFEVPDGCCVITADLAVEGTHFLMGWMSPREIGYRNATAALSDLAAMAAAPIGVLASVGLSAEWPEDFLAELMAGIGEAAEATGAMVMGGDTVASDRLVLDVTAVGAMRGAAVRRSGAEPGDRLYVTGLFGGPAAAIDAWKSGSEPDRAARERFVRPMARVREAAWLRDRGATAMIDVSDGLMADVGHIAAASGVGCTIALDRVPLHKACTSRRTAVVSGEEYELLVAMPQSVEKLTEQFADEFGLPLHDIGGVVSGGGVRIEDHGVPLTDLTPFSHF